MYNFTRHYTRNIFQESTAFKFDANLRTTVRKKTRKVTLAAQPATVPLAESKVELLGAVREKKMKRDRFEGVLTLVARDNETIASMLRIFRRWIVQFQDVDALWVPSEWNDFWGSNAWKDYHQERRGEELNPIEKNYAVMPRKCQVKKYDLMSLKNRP